MTLFYYRLFFFKTRLFNSIEGSMFCLYYVFQMDYISEWKPATHKYHIDLWAANRLQLLDFGVPSAQVETANICTFTQYEEFFSARRMGIKSGRILSGIMLTHSNGLH